MSDKPRYEQIEDTLRDRGYNPTSVCWNIAVSMAEWADNNPKISTRDYRESQAQVQRLEARIENLATALEEISNTFEIDWDEAQQIARDALKSDDELSK